MLCFAELQEVLATRPLRLVQRGHSAGIWRHDDVRDVPTSAFNQDISSWAVHNVKRYGSDVRERLGLRPRHQRWAVIASAASSTTPRPSTRTSAGARRRRPELQEHPPSRGVKQVSGRSGPTPRPKNSIMTDSTRGPRRGSQRRRRAGHDVSTWERRGDGCRAFSTVEVHGYLQPGRGVLSTRISARGIPPASRRCRTCFRLVVQPGHRWLGGPVSTSMQAMPAQIGLRPGPRWLGGPQRREHALHGTEPATRTSAGALDDGVDLEYAFDQTLCERRPEAVVRCP